MFALFSLCYLQYGASIFSISRKIAILFSKFWSVSSISSFPITMSWNISTVSLMWNFFASQFLWDTVILFIITTFLIYLNKFASTKFLLKSLPSYFRIPFTQDSNSIFSITTFCFSDAFSSLLYNSLSIISLWNATAVYGENKEAIVFLSVLNWTTTNQWQILKDVTWLVTDHDVHLLFSKKFVHRKGSGQVFTSCYHSQLTYVVTGIWTFFKGNLQLVN